MASLVVLGSNQTDATLTTACDMVLTTTGGTETSVITTTSGSNKFAEVFSIAGSTTGFTALQSPSGKGWVYNKPGAGTFATGNWSASVTFVPNSWSGSSSTTHITLRAYQYSGGSYTSIGAFPDVPLTGGLTKTTYSFGPTSFSSVTFGASDLLYIDFWYFDNTGLGTDNPKVFLSNATNKGVANDMQITTSNFTAGGGGAVHLLICDGYGGVFS